MSRGTLGATGRLRSGGRCGFCTLLAVWVRTWALFIIALAAEEGFANALFLWCRRCSRTTLQGGIILVPDIHVDLSVKGTDQELVGFLFVPPAAIADTS